MVRVRWAWIVAGAFGAAAAVSLAVGIPTLRSRVRAEIEQRCGRAVEGHCHVGALELARDGVVVRDLAVQLQGPGRTARVHALAVAMSWWRLIRGAPQDVDVTVDRVSFADRGPVEDSVRELTRLGRRHPVRTARGRVHVASLHVESMDGSAGDAGGPNVMLEDGRGGWTRTNGVELEWRDLSVMVGGELAVHTGSCRFTRGAASAGEMAMGVQCDAPTVRVDIASMDRVDESLRGLIAALREASREEPRAGREPGATGPRVENVSGSPRVTLRARGGSVRVMRGGATIAELSPADVSADLRGSSVEQAHVRLGAAASGPALEVLFERGTNPRWHAELTGDDLPLAEITHWLPGVPWHGAEHGRVQLRVRVEPVDPGGDVLVVDGSIGIDSFGLLHPGLAHDPVDGLSASIEGAGRVDVRRRRVESEGVRMRVNGITVALAGWFERPDSREIALDASLRMPVTSCDGIRRALPPSVTGPVDELTFSGSIAADAHLALDTRALTSTELQVDLDNRCTVARDRMLLGVGRLRTVFVQRVHEPTGLRAFVTGPGSAAWVPLAQVSPYVTRAVIVREDGRFYSHHGFDVGEIRGAIVRNVGARRFVYGASTLSMQLVKNVFLQREKTLVRKLQEVVLTWYLERSLAKDSILELYLNVVEFGPGIYGIGPAARFFFGRDPADLSPLQAIYLATLLPNPLARFASYQRGSVSPGTLGVLRSVARRMAAAGYLSSSELDFAQTESLVFRPARAPVRGAQTQTVPTGTTDEMAAAMSPVPSETVPVVLDGDAAGGDAGSVQEAADTEPEETR